MELVRTATPDDVDRMVELVAASGVSRADGRGADLARSDDGGGSPPAATPEALAPYLTGPARTALVATLDDWVAGAALCRVLGGDGVPRGVLDLCFVEPGAREVGLGHLLVEHALAWYRAQGCSGVDGSAHPGDRSAKSFFESAGFKTRLLVMYRPLD